MFNPEIKFQKFKTIFYFKCPRRALMDLYTVIESALTIAAGSFFVIIGGSYLAYKIRKKL